MNEPSRPIRNAAEVGAQGPLDENFDVFDFELTQDQMTAIAAMDTRTRVSSTTVTPTRCADSAPPGSTSEPTSVLLDRPIQVGFGVSDRWAKCPSTLSWAWRVASAAPDSPRVCVVMDGTQPPVAGSSTGGRIRLRGSAFLEEQGLP
jgi:hypothetical protein